MDKYEYKVRSEEISKLIDKEKYAEAVKIADTIDWRRVKSAAMLLKIAALYRISRRNEDSREMLMLAYERYPTNRSVVYSLCELSIELDDVVAAIEYYKQFAKLAPKDNGVYTLRYRILEAQEASLEERIEILEELKKKDYQEEWAYELAYLYHRVGLSTKCVEECDDIILWFGDGPYVMKAMELKAKHVPLTEVQQQNYNIMLGNAGQNYSSGNYDTENYDTDEYAADNYDGQNYDTDGYDSQNYNAESYDADGYNGQNYSAEGYDEQNYSPEGYDGQNYSAEGYDSQNYSAEGYDSPNYNVEGYDGGNYNAQDYSGENYNEQNYDADNYDTQGYNAVNYDGQNYSQGNFDIANDSNESYEDEAYTNMQYSNESYENEAYTNAQYSNESYGDEAYANESDGEQYAEAGYGQENYAKEQYTNDNYGQNSLVDDGYGNLSYVDDSYQDNGYTGAFYVEQAYDENGNLINPEMYSDEDYPQGSYDYPQDEGVRDNSYEEQVNASKEYRNGLHLVENTAAPAGNASDMSQYNTINLQKVVAESMKELFPDDDDDVFAEDREKYNSGANISSVGDTRIFAGVTNPDVTQMKLDNDTEVADEPANSHTQTGRVRIAQMVTGVLEKAPEPHTGAIKKVIVPGDDARSIKSDSNIDELRDITEKSVDDEHNRMEHNDENVYHEQSIMGENEADESSQATGPMNLDDVLVEWERMKQDNAKKHQEEIKKRVLTQTGKIFVNFDNSIKSGILGELQREEEEAERSNQAGSAPRQGSSSKGKSPAGSSTTDRFLDADVTGDIPQQSALEDDFDVEYVTDHQQPTEVQESGNSEEIIESELSEDSEVDAREEFRSGLGQAASQELGAAMEEETEVEGFSDKADEDIQEIPTERAAGNVAEAYSQKTYEEGATEDYGDSEYTQKISMHDVENYAGENSSYLEEAYKEENPEYAEQAYATEGDGYIQETYDAEESYEENAPEYAEETYEEDAGQYTERLFTEDADGVYPAENEYSQEDNADASYIDEDYDELEDAYNEPPNVIERRPNAQYKERELDPEDAESIAEMAKEDALKTQEIKMNTADLSSLSEKIVATTKKEARGAAREELREFTPEEQTLFENFAVTKKIKKQIIYALENMTLAPYIGNVIITGDAGLDTVRMAKNLIKEYQASDESFSGKLAKITGEKINQRNIKDVFEKLNNGGIIIEKANGMSEEKLYEMALCLTQENFAIVVIMEDTKKEITKLLEKQAMIVDYFNIRIDLMEMDNNALVAYAKNYALALEYSIDELGTLALYTRIANMQSGNHVVTKDEVRDIIDEAIWKSKKSKIKNFVDVLFARRYDNEDMIVLKERDFM